MKKRNSIVDQEAKARSKKLYNHVTNERFFGTFRFKLMASFMVPILFIILLGIVSVSKASDMIESKYIKASEALIHMASERMNLGFQSVQSSALLLANDSLIIRYSISQDDKRQSFVYKDALGNVLCSKKAADELIRNIYLVNANVDSLSTGESVDSGIYDSFMKTDLGKALDDKKTLHIWDGEDAFLDMQLKTSTEDYSMRHMKKVTNFESFLIIDVRAEFVENILSDLNFDNTGYLRFVTPDGKEIIDASIKQKDSGIDSETHKSDKIFVNQAFYQEAMAEKEENGSSYVNYMGDTYLFQYSKVGDTGAALCALIPKSTVISQADRIKNVTIIIVIIASIVTIIIATQFPEEHVKRC
jgi:methyl-accepting chemotaxis protein